MNYYLLVPLLLSIALIIILIIILYKNKNKLNEISNKLNYYKTIKQDELKVCFQEEWERKEKEEESKLRIKREDLQKQWQLTFQKHQLQLSNLDNEIKKFESILKEKEKRYEEINQDLDLYKKGKIKEIDDIAAEYKQHQQTIIKEELEKYREHWTDEFNNELVKISESKDKALNELKEITIDLEIERSKRAAINEEIRKEEEKEKYNEIHSVQLTNNEKEDIHFLLSLEDRLHNKQPLYKLVWSTYLQQAYKNTFNNILGNRNPKNVIYCIENINTGKKYIGKTSAEVSKRWTEHIKTSLNIGTIKTTNIHKALYNHWDEFIFYVLTETEKDKLSEMEKYYINFYESDKYGYNIKAGG